MKHMHYKSVMAEADYNDIISHKPIIKIIISHGNYKTEPIGEFFLPRTTLMEGWEVTRDAIIARCKRDFSVTFEHLMTRGLIYGKH